MHFGLPAVPLCAALLAAGGGSLGAAAQQSAPSAGSVAEALERKTAAKIRALDESLDGVLGFAVIDLNSGATFAYRGDTVFPQASSIKVPLMIELFRAARNGAFGLDDPVTMTAADSVGGSGNLQIALKKGPVKTTVRGLLRAMIQDSDNAATNKLIGMVGMERVNATMEAAGFKQTRLQRRMMDAAAAERNDENVSTPVEMARIFEMIYRGKAVDEAASREMIGLLELVKADIRKAVPQGIEVAAKPGDLDGVHCETGIVYIPGHPFVVSIMSTFLGEKNPVPDAAGIAYAYFEKIANSNRYGHRVR